MQLKLEAYSELAVVNSERQILMGNKNCRTTENVNKQVATKGTSKARGEVNSNLCF